MTALAQRWKNPVAVVFNDDGRVVDGFATIDVPLPAWAEAKVRVMVGYFPRRGSDLPGWRAEIILEAPRKDFIAEQSAPCRARDRAIIDAADALTNRLVDASDFAHRNRKQWLKAIIDAVNSFSEKAGKQAKKEQAMVSARSKILNQKECRSLLENFHERYEAFGRSFIELGERAAAIREQEAYSATESDAGECQTFDQWIQREGYSRTVVYDSMKAARLNGLMAPTLQPRQITLDCESHFRDIPADVTPSDAKKIATELVKAASEARSTKITRQQVKAAVERIRPRPKTQAPRPSPVIDVESSAVADEPRTPRVAPETITGEYAEVAAETNAGEPWSKPLQAFQTSIKAMLAPLLKSYGHDGHFLYAAKNVLADISVEVRYYEPEKASPQKAATGRKAK
jgi:hypothetical protein